MQLFLLLRKGSVFPDSWLTVNISLTFFSLLQTRLEKEEFEEELKELQERVSTMKQQTIDHSQTQALNQV